MLLWFYGLTGWPADAWEGRAHRPARPVSLPSRVFYALCDNLKDREFIVAQGGGKVIERIRFLPSKKGCSTGEEPSHVCVCISVCVCVHV